jgi:excisionase family DNA binding protein
MYTVAQAAKVLRITPAGVYKLLKRKKLLATRHAGTWVIPYYAVEARLKLYPIKTGPKKGAKYKPRKNQKPKPKEYVRPKWLITPE